MMGGAHGALAAVGAVVIAGSLAEPAQIAASTVASADRLAAQNGLIAYTTGGGELDSVVRTIKPDGTDNRRLIGARPQFRRGASGARWSPDGKRVLFGGHHHYDNPAGSLWHATAAGKRVTQIPLHLGGTGKGPRSIRLYGWDWARSQRRVVFAAARPGDRLPRLYTIALDGTKRRALVRGSNPSWSSTSRRISFEIPRFDGEFWDHEIAVVRPDGRDARSLAHSDPTHYVDSPSFSPDGRSVLYRTQPQQGAGATAWRSVEIHGENDSLLRDIPYQADMRYLVPQWTPDERIAAMRGDSQPLSDDRTWGLVTFDPKTSDEQLEFTFPGPSFWYDFNQGYFSWRPVR